MRVFKTYNFCSFLVGILLYGCFLLPLAAEGLLLLRADFETGKDISFVQDYDHFESLFSSIEREKGEGAWGAHSPSEPEPGFAAVMGVVTLPQRWASGALVCTLRKEHVRHMLRESCAIARTGYIFHAGETLLFSILRRESSEDDHL